MDNIIIQSVTIGDIDDLQKISIQTFYETFSAENSEENMRKYLEDNFSAAKLTEELRDEYAEFYFALHNDKAVGYLKINSGESQTELKDSNALEIERIYVLREYLGKKVGQRLYEYAIKIAIDKKADYLWLGVWEENARAINFYKKNGFIEFDKHIFRLGDDEQIDIMMKLDLKNT